MALRTYVHSGRVGLGALLLGPLAGVGAALLLAVVYQYAVYFIPLIYVNFLLTLAFGAGMGLAVGYALKFGKCRNAVLGIAIAALSAVAAVGVSHGVSYRIELGRAQKELAAQGIRAEEVEAEVDFGRFLEFKAEAGWVIGRPTSTNATGAGPAISGIFVWLIWVVELVAVVAVAARLAPKPFRAPFCEPCGKWATPIGIGTISRVKTPRLKIAIRNDDMQSIVEPGPQETPAAKELKHLLDGEKLARSPAIEKLGAAAALLGGGRLARVEFLGLALFLALFLFLLSFRFLLFAKAHAGHRVLLAASFPV